MLDDVGMQTFWNEIQRLWINPEIERRQSEGTLPDRFGIRQCLIRLPEDKPPTVEFNNEIQFLTTIKLPVGMAMDAGDPVFLWQVERITAVERPTVDGVPVPFVYIHWNGLAWQLIFDFTPNPSSDNGPWGLSDAIAKALNGHLRERAIAQHRSVQDKVATIGLWPAPALFPYPMSAIVERCQNGATEEARQILVGHCKVEFLEPLVASWSNVPSFALRGNLFATALDAHRKGNFMVSIYLLVPQLEGVVTDWLYSNKDIGEVKYREASKLSQFKEVMTNGNAIPQTEQSLIEETVSFIISGPVFQQFTDWILPNSPFPNRHAVCHGKFDESVFTQENSCKVFLLLDSLHHFMESVELQHSE